MKPRFHRNVQRHTKKKFDKRNFFNQKLQADFCTHEQFSQKILKQNFHNGKGCYFFVYLISVFIEGPLYEIETIQIKPKMLSHEQKLN